eukprot:7139169-Pyramimonas_sp.AAC.1
MVIPSPFCSTTPLSSMSLLTKTLTSPADMGSVSHTPEMQLSKSPRSSLPEAQSTQASERRRRVAP